MLVISIVFLVVLVAIMLIKERDDDDDPWERGMRELKRGGRPPGVA